MLLYKNPGKPQKPGIITVLRLRNKKTPGETETDGMQKAGMHAGPSPAPTIVLAGLTDAEKRALRSADNTIALGASWDLDLLKLELGDLSEMNSDVSFTGWRDDNVRALKEAKPHMGGLTGHAADVWRPLFAVSGDWPTAVRRAALSLAELTHGCREINRGCCLAWALSD